MSQVVGLSLSIAILGAIWAFLALGPLSGFVLVWAGFIAWGCFFHTGGDNKALTKTIVGTAYGAVLAWIALMIIVHVPINTGSLPIWPAILVGYSLHQASAPPATGPLMNLTAVSFANPLILLIVSFVIGAILGYLSGQP